MILKKFMLAAAGVAAALALAGCSSFTAADNLNNVQIAPKSSPDTYQAHIHAEVWGIYLMGVIPVFTGSTVSPGRCAVFEDTVNIPSTIGMTTKLTKARMNTEKIYDLQSETTSTWLSPTILFWYKAVQVSGNISR
ncbi:MAG: hypothetical protein IKB22_10345 [Lentisphaeria bacterium]|nr:hypothetical protein [Lentisphaeria bacterium]